ncbi:MAG: Hpt domain-containing protein [Lachnospiraceae bacterium]|nr:Hpt domain-containing protein [Lachnospiraceae bacterium]
MNEKILNNAGIDCHSGIRRFSGRADLYEKYLKKFPDDENMQLAKKAIEEKNYEELLEYVHTLKGVTGNLSITELFGSCDELVDILRAKEFNHADAIFKRICLLYADVCKAIKAENEN